MPFSARCCVTLEQWFSTFSNSLHIKHDNNSAAHLHLVFFEKDLEKSFIYKLQAKSPFSPKSSSKTKDKTNWLHTWKELMAHRLRNTALDFTNVITSKNRALQ